MLIGPHFDKRPPVCKQSFFCLRSKSVEKIEYPETHNTRIWFKTKDGKPVKVTKCIDYKDLVECEDLQGAKKDYDIKTDLNYIAISTTGNYIEIIRDKELMGSKIGDYSAFGYEYITKNIREFNNWCYREFYWIRNNISEELSCHVYEYEELSDDQIKTIVLEELIYGKKPNLESRSCVGSREKGLDKDRNYRNGQYLLNNNKYYTVTWCYGRIHCREGRDNGWYHNKEKAGREIFSAKMDWERYREACINSFIVNRLLQQGNTVSADHPEVVKAIYDQVKDWDRFKLSHEFLEKTDNGIDHPQH